MTDVSIVDYTSSYRQAFRALNEAWIMKYFELEEEDHKMLSDPDKIIREGGYIFVALLGEEAVGVCALRKISSDTYELSKMSVAEKTQGLGIGRKLGEAAIAKGAQVGAKRIYLEGNTILESSMHLYRKLGFKEVAGQQSHYKRVNIQMEKLL